MKRKQISTTEEDEDDDVDEIKILDRDFYARDTLEVAKDLLGKVLVRIDEEGHEMRGIIVETEAYTENEKGCHGYKGKSARNAVMFGEPGYAYIYMIYGMYSCLNLVTERSGRASAVLIRALEPVDGIEDMRQNRTAKKNGARPGKDKDIANGPGKLCMAMKLTKKENGIDVCIKSSGLFVLDAPKTKSTDIVSTTRIGIDYAGKDALLPWRFYIKGNSCVSKK